MAEFHNLRTWRPLSDGDEAGAGPPSVGAGGPRSVAVRGPKTRPASRRPSGGSVALRRRPVEEASAQITAPPPRLPLPSWLGAAFDRSTSRAPGARSQAPTLVPVPAGQGSMMPPDEGWELELSQLLEQADATIFHWQPPGVSPRARSTAPAPGRLSQAPVASGLPRGRATSLGSLRREPPRPGAGARANATLEGRPSVGTSRSALPSLGPASMGFGPTFSFGPDAPMSEPAPRPSFAAGRAVERPSAVAVSINVSPTRSYSELVDGSSFSAPAYPQEAPSAPAYAEEGASAEGAYAEDGASAEGAYAEDDASAAEGSSPPVAYAAATSFGPGSGRQMPPPLPEPASDPAILLSTFPPPPSSLMLAAGAVGAGDYLDEEAGEQDDDGGPVYAPNEWSPADAGRMPGPPRRPTFGSDFATEMIAMARPSREGAGGSSPRRGEGPGLDFVLQDPFPVAPGARSGEAEAPEASGERQALDAAMELTDDEMALVHGRTLWSRLTRRRR